MHNHKISTEIKLAEDIGSFYADPLGFVMYVFPWGDEFLHDGETANPLKNKTGPEPWQRELLVKMGEHIQNNVDGVDFDIEPDIWRSAVASGHGVGKSAFVAWVSYFFMSTRADTRGVVTANTQFQLEDKTWPELAKWHGLAINRHWFEWTATSFYFKAYPEDKRKNYMLTAATVSETRPEAFQGLHNVDKTVLVIFDEASAIHSKIWEVADGALTDGEGFFLAFGNPTRPDGDFADCFDKHKALYHTVHVDSREVSHTNKKALQGIINKYGIDDDRTKVRVYGQFPSQSFDGFISLNVVNDAVERDYVYDGQAGLIMAVDVARYGDDLSIIGFRQGRDARSRPMRKYSKLGNVEMADRVAEAAGRERPDAIVIESTGPGAGVIDILRFRGFRITEIHPGANAIDHEHYANRRAEIWGLGRDWIVEQGCLPDDENMRAQLVAIRYTLDRQEQRYLMEAKKDMKKRGLSSPDEADMLMLTFAVKVARRDANHNRKRPGTKALLHDDPLGEM
ncbi:MAG: terminase [Candidatus Sabulitectum sp.]|nr:terminase [Candidatus Sabulitectum sp.]